MAKSLIDRAIIEIGVHITNELAMDPVDLITVLRALRQAKKDKARLDWLLGREALVTYDKRGFQEKVYHARQAIDKAMKEGK